MQHTKESKRIEGVTRKGQRFQAKAKAKQRWWYIGTFDTQAEAEESVCKFHTLMGSDGNPAMAAMTVQTQRSKPKPCQRFNRPGGKR